MKNAKSFSSFIFLILYISILISLSNSTETNTNEKNSVKSKTVFSITNKLNSRSFGQLLSSGKFTTQNKASLTVNSQFNLNSKVLSSVLKNSSKKANGDKANTEEVIDLNPNTGNSPIWKGWIKYFYFKSANRFTQPQTFFINNKYYDQRVFKDKLLDKGPLAGEGNNSDNNLFIHIPSKFHFYATINNQELQINSDRLNPLTSKLETLNIDLIDPPSSTDMEKNGLKDLGKYDEGFCFDISVHTLYDYDSGFVPTYGDFKGSEPVHWIICTEEEAEKVKIISTLTSLIEAREKLRKRDDSKAGQALKSAETNEEHYQGFGANALIDGYLVKIQDWTKCTLKCGGGYSYQQWRCIPPKEGGKPCAGDLIRKKKCNEDPCPEVSSQKDEKTGNQKKVEEVIKDPIFKSTFVSNRPQQNLECVVREEDVLFEYNDEVNGKIDLPSRLVLNTKSLTLFSDIEEKKSVFSFDLAKTSLLQVSDQDCCFWVKNENKKYKICGMKCNKFPGSWMRSFDLFRTKCYNVLDSQPEDPSKANNPVDASSQTVNQSDLALNMEIDQGSAKAKSAVISAKLEQKFNVSKQDEVSKTQKKAMKVINREIDIEDLIRKEEMVRTQDRLKSKLNELQHEEKKKEKLEEAIDNQAKSNGSVVEAIKAKQSIQEIQKETEKDLLERRNTLKKKLQKIRLLADRRSRIIDNKIVIIRNKMTRDLMEVTKTGNQAVCKDAWGNKEQMSQYCDENIIDDVVKNIDCKLKDNFCFSCCDNEFGKANTVGKEGCYNFCLEKEGLKGDWVKNPNI